MAQLLSILEHKGQLQSSHSYIKSQLQKGTATNTVRTPRLSSRASRNTRRIYNPVTVATRHSYNLVTDTTNNRYKQRTVR